MEGSKPLIESKHCLSLKCVLFLFYGGLGCIYPFLQSNMAHKGFDFNEIYSISAIIPIAALFGPLVFAVLVDKWATSSAFAYGKRVRILTAVSLIASIILYVVLMFGVSRNPPPGLCEPQVSFMCNKKGAYLMQEKCSAEGVCHDWDYNKAGILNLENCAYKCQQDVQFESTCYDRLELESRTAAIQDQESDNDDIGDVVEESETIRTDEGSGDTGKPHSNDLDGDGIPNDQDPDDDNDGIPDTQDNDDDNDGIPDAEDMDDDNDGIPDSKDPDSKITANDLDGDGIPNDQDDDDDNDGIPDSEDSDDDNDGIIDAEDDDDDNDGIPDSEDTDGKRRSNDFDGDGIPNDKDDDDDNDGIPDVLDDDDDNDGIVDAEDDDDDNDGIPDSEDKDGKSLSNDLDGDGIPNDQDDDDDNDGIPDSEDSDDDNDGIIDAEDDDDDNDGIPDSEDTDGKRRSNDFDGDGIPNDKDDDDDNDGIPDLLDDDDDNDGIVDAEDDDDDNDGIPDSEDKDGKSSSNDLDGDGIPNDKDDDDDNDGIPDVLDDDDDNDGIVDAEDDDDDNDGIPDSEDKDGKSLSNDLDGDGIPNDQDDDDDNDGIPDSQDDDDDNDGIVDTEDDDDDNDGIPDSEDLDAKSRGNDFDGDGIPNDKDDDDDNDGIPDSEDPDDDNDGVPDVKDTDDDNDGIPDYKDKDSKYDINDLDGDGIPNELDDDDDGDGIPDAEDDDDDNDGIKDDEDIDDDNDGIPDDKEGQPINNDLDGDGIPNDVDDDDDNDGIPDTDDQDDDNDGIPDAEDADDDNDGIPDILDANSRNANDLDGDGIPNDLDDDDDNDGVKDTDDNDDDNDGIPDAVDNDDDNDGVPDENEGLVQYVAPQICHDPAVDNSDEDDEDDEEQCYTFDGKTIKVKASIDEHNERDDVEECVYPLDGFKCHIDKAWIKDQEQGCKPVIECSLSKAYAHNSSLLYGTECDGDEDNDGDDDRGDSTYYYYLSVRSLLDFFLLAALTLFNTIIVVTTRDASTGIADFGRQLVWGAIGWIIFFNDDYEQPYFWFIILNTIAAVILLSPLQMDLSPPEEWWKFKTVPQKFFSGPAFIKYGKQSWLPFLITIGLGSLWSIIDSIDKSHMVDIPKDAATDGSAFRTVFRTLLLAGDLLAIPVLVFSQRIIQVFGTCKILVAAFLALVLRFILLAIFDWEYWDIIEDALLPATLGLTWVTLVLHFRDILPRKVTAIAQSLPVIAHFGFGRFFGALIGIENDYDNLENDYEVLAGVLFAITILSIVLYRYREIILTQIGQYIPALKPCEKEKVLKVGKGETDV
ncbi:dentin sialophosphoprotein-like isoform X4 [Armigeres subalbatus]|uniref:dentin sialophosphoprotein-like isoform X4 n=1 Tax=Armigeres subalbatus TaxID=124917 RepID=UPI002ED4C82C